MFRFLSNPDFIVSFSATINPKGTIMEYQKYTRHCFKRLTADEVREFREMQEAQSIAWMTGNKSRAAELGKILAELRSSNLAYRNLYA